MHSNDLYMIKQNVETPPNLPATFGTTETLESDESRKGTSSGAAENVSDFDTELVW